MHVHVLYTLKLQYFFVLHVFLCSNWISSLNNDAHDSFLRGAEIGSTIQENWLTYNSGVYLWNYHRNHLTRGAKSAIDLVNVFKKLYQLLEGNQLVSFLY